MTTAPMLFDAYTMAADNLIAVMLHDEQLCSRIQDDLRLHPGWFPTVQHIQAFSAILTLRNTGHTDSLHATAVMNLAPMVKSEWLGRLYSNGLDAGGNIDPILTTHFNSDAEIVKEHGTD
jgi:hypothetical protein